MSLFSALEFSVHTEVEMGAPHSCFFRYNPQVP